MSEPANAPSPPVIPPALPVAGELTAPPLLRGPWGLWATVGWSAVIGFVYLAVQIFVVAVYVVGIMILNQGKSPPSQADIESNGLVLGLAVIACAPAMVGLSILFAKLRQGPTVRDYLGLHWPSVKAFSYWIVGLLALSVASDWLTLALGRPIVPEVMVTAYQNTSLLPVLWIAMVLAAPLSEEFFFRGFLFRGLCESRVGGRAPVFLTAGLWALIHLQYDLYGIGTIFVSGIVLGFARLKTGSVLLCTVMHAMDNLLATFEVHFCFLKY